MIVVGGRIGAAVATLRGFARHRPGDQARLLAAALLLPFVRVAVVVAPFARLRRGLVAIANGVAPLIPGDPAPERVSWAVDVADRYLPGDRTCLMRSLTAETLHRLYGHDVAHRIGVDPSEPGDVAAHSWIERDGEVILGGLEDLDRYEPLGDLDDGAGR